MDTTETYIKMCDCPEIQDGIEETGGTWIGNNILYHIAPMNQSHNRDGYYYILDKEVIERCKTCGHEEPYCTTEKVIWLPRQDQLQEMVFDERITAIVIAHELFNYALTISKVKIGKGMEAYPKLSMEQLWLAFVMKEKFNKIWNGESWNDCP